MDIILALDVGEKKIGLAVGDTDTRMAFVRPALLVESWDAVWEPLAKTIREAQVTSILVGLPLNDDGSVGPQAERTQQFVFELEERFDLPVVTRDERHSSQAVQREQRTVGQRLARGEEDSLVAQLLLESYLSEQA